MKPKPLIHTAALIATSALVTGCVGYNTALFMTKSNAGLDFDSKPPTVEVNISRKEGVVEPTFEGGKTPPVMASFSVREGTDGGFQRFFLGVNQTFAGGDAAVTMAKLFDTTNAPSDANAGIEKSNKMRFDSGVQLSQVPSANRPAGKGWLGWKKKVFGLPEPGEIRPFFFGTDTQLGVKVGWNGLGGPYPDNLKIGFNRKEIAVAPVTFTAEETIGDTLKTNVVRIPSFLATVDSDVNVTKGTGITWIQYFATGDSATFLARQYGVRKAMLERADPKASPAAKTAGESVKDIPEAPPKPDVNSKKKDDVKVYYDDANTKQKVLDTISKPANGSFADWNAFWAGTPTPEQLDNILKELKN